MQAAGKIKIYFNENTVKSIIVSSLYLSYSELSEERKGDVLSPLLFSFVQHPIRKVKEEWEVLLQN